MTYCSEHGSNVHIIFNLERSLKTELSDSDEMSDELKTEFVELCHQLVNWHDAANSWWTTSVSTFEEYVWNEGNPGLMWNGTGYRALFDILMVTEVYHSYFHTSCSPPNVRRRCLAGEMSGAV